MPPAAGVLLPWTRLQERPGGGGGVVGMIHGVHRWACGMQVRTSWCLHLGCHACVYIYIHTYVTYIWGMNDWRLVVVRGLQHFMLLETGVEQLHRL